MNKKIFMPFLVLIAFYSCESEVTFNISSDNLIVVNSILKADSIIQVHVSESQYLSDSSQTININTADVSIYKDSTFIENLAFTGAGIYKASFKPTAATKYTIQVNSDNLTSVNSATTIPAKTKIDTVITLRKQYLDYSNYTCTQITFTDDESTNDYYILKMWGSLFWDVDSSWDEETETYLDSTLIFSKKPFYLNDPLISSTNNSSSSEIISSITGTYESNNDRLDWIAFSDKNINGTKHTIELYLYQMANTTKEYPLYIYLEPIHQDYYYYLQSIANTDSYLENAISGVVSSVYSNIENGAGIFSSANVFVYPLTENHWSEEE